MYVCVLKYEYRRKNKLETLKKQLSKPLSNTVNLSFSTETFGQAKRLQREIPVFKDDVKLYCSNYRPISAISNMRKVFEKCLMH